METTIHKKILIANFVAHNNILSFIEFIKNKFLIPIDKIFVFTISDNTKEFLVTYNVPMKDKDKAMEIKGSSIVHIKNGSIFSINAINKMTKTGARSEISEIDWSKYKNKLMMVSGGELQIKDICKIDDKSIFLRK